MARRSLYHRSTISVLRQPSVPLSRIIHPRFSPPRAKFLDPWVIFLSKLHIVPLRTRHWQPFKELKCAWLCLPSNRTFKPMRVPFHFWAMPSTFFVTKLCSQSKLSLSVSSHVRRSPTNLSRCPCLAVNHRGFVVRVWFIGFIAVFS